MSPQQKRVLAKQDGRLLTDKQKKERQQAELQRQALINSGAIIEGLNKSEGSTAPKKVVYGKRQRGPKNAAAAPSVTGSSAPSTPKTAPDVALPPEEEPVAVQPAKKIAPPKEPKEEKEETSDWDASSDEEDKKEKPVVEAKDDWDASSDEEKKASATKAAKVEPKSE
jgi:translation initiation factor 5B